MKELGYILVGPFGVSPEIIGGESQLAIRALFYLLHFHHDNTTALCLLLAASIAPRDLSFPVLRSSLTLASCAPLSRRHTARHAFEANDPPG